MTRAGRLAPGLLAVVLLLPATAPATDAPVRVRKDVRSLTARERHDFTAAVVRLKRTRSPYDRRLNYYDQFVRWHVDLYRCTAGRPQMLAHGGPMFLPWHRAYLLAFENALREVSGKPVTVPYWDWTSPESTRAMFSLVGGAGDPEQDYAVTKGPFRKGRFRIRVQPEGPEYDTSHGAWITRNPGSIPTVELPTTAEVSAALRAPAYDGSPFDNRSDPARSFRTVLEGFHDPPEAGTTGSGCGDDHLLHSVSPKPNWSMHNAVHPWVGGVYPRAGTASLGSLGPNSSPNDPVFFLHHANVDRLWGLWQIHHARKTYRPLTGFRFNTATSVMKPFDRSGVPDTPRGVEHINRLGYRYAGVPASAAVARASGGYVCRLWRQ